MNNADNPMNSNGGLAVYIGLMSKYEDKLQALFTEMLGHQTNLANDPVESVHALRKLTKFTRALLRLNPLADPHLNQIMKQVSLTLAPYRDAQVNLMSYQTLTALHPEIASTELTATLERNPYILQNCPNIAEQQLLEDLIQKFQSQITSNQRTLTSEATRQGIAQSYTKASQVFGMLHSTSDVEEVHTGRKRIKTTWYQLRYLFDDQEQPPEHIQSRFDALGSLLGETHDLDMLAFQLRDRSGSRFQDFLNNKRSQYLDQILSLGHELLKHSTPHFVNQLTHTEVPTIA